MSTTPIAFGAPRGHLSPEEKRVFFSAVYKYPKGVPFRYWGHKGDLSRQSFSDVNVSDLDTLKYG